MCALTTTPHRAGYWASGRCSRPLWRLSRCHCQVRTGTRVQMHFLWLGVCEVVARGQASQAPSTLLASHTPMSGCHGTEGSDCRQARPVLPLLTTAFQTTTACCARARYTRTQPVRWLTRHLWLCPAHGCAGACDPAVATNAARIYDVLSAEESQFSATLERGQKQLNEMLARAGGAGRVLGCGWDVGTAVGVVRMGKSCGDVDARGWTWQGAARGYVAAPFTSASQAQGCDCCSLLLLLLVLMPCATCYLLITAACTCQVEPGTQLPLGA